MNAAKLPKNFISRKQDKKHNNPKRKWEKTYIYISILIPRNIDNDLSPQIYNHTKEVKIIGQTFVSACLEAVWEFCSFFCPSVEQILQKKWSSLFASSAVMFIQTGWNLNDKQHVKTEFNERWIDPCHIIDALEKTPLAWKIQM